LGEGELEPKAESFVLKKSSTGGDPKTGFFAASSRLGLGLVSNCSIYAVLLGVGQGPEPLRAGEA
jgi:hypothetical protein